MLSPFRHVVLQLLDAMVSSMASISMALSSLVILNQEEIELQQEPITEYSHETEQKRFGFCCEIGFRVEEPS